MKRVAGANGVLLWVSWLLVLWWLVLRVPYLLAPVALLLVASSFSGMGMRRSLAAIALIAGSVVALYGHVSDRRFVSGWEAYWSERQSELADQLSTQVDDLVSRGDESVLQMERLSRLNLPGPELADSLSQIQARYELDALAVYGSDGRLTAWAGRHHGRVPTDLLDPNTPYTYSETPLFSYLYFVSEGGGGDLVLAAALMEVNLPESLEVGVTGFASQFRAVSGEAIRVSRSDRAVGDAVYDFGWPDQTLLSITVVEPSRTTRRKESFADTATAVMVLLGLAWLLLASSGTQIGWSASALTIAAAVLPLEVVFHGPWFDPAAFMVGGPIPMTLGRIMALALALVPAAILVSSRPQSWLRPWLGAVVSAAAFTVVLRWLGDAASLELVGGPGSAWIVFQVAIALILVLVLSGLLILMSRGRDGIRWVTVLAGLALATGFGLFASTIIRSGAALDPRWAAAWGIPSFFVLLGLSGRLKPRSYLVWLTLIWLAGTVSLPFAWGMRTTARMTLAEEELGRLGVGADPYLEYLLDRFAAAVDSLDQTGASHVDLLYESWISSGLGDEGSPIHLTLWSRGNIPLHELRVGMTGGRPRSVDELLASLRQSGGPERIRLRRADAHYLVGVPISGGRLVTGAVPPRRTVASASPLGPLFASAERGKGFLTLIRPLAGDQPSVAQGIRWSQDDEGLRAETVVQYPDQPYDVFYTLSTPAPTVMVARATLILVLTAGVLSGVWIIAVVALTGALPLPVPVATLLTSFRARVTWTLFGFFLLSNAIFGTLAYRTLSGASERTARALAERVVGQISDAYLEEGGEMELLARRVGADLLEYRSGELVGGSVDDLVDLGLYEGWIERDVYDALQSRQQLRAARVGSLGAWRYVLAYRRLPDGDIVASPVPLRAGANALRSRDVADLLGFAIILGPLLSLGLALLVGRALTRPIQTLQIASERVGSGNLAVHLPDDRVDEFGAVFEAFNRMVLRLGDARRELLQTTRRTEAIVEEAATGVIALDREGRVTVANPRAEALLAVPVKEGEPVPSDTPLAAELLEWLAEFHEKGVRESAADFESGDRRIQVRARRIARERGMGGVVVILEDVTDELRSERILAWGEMAQQVAHEVKNPLTPIKLSVQHLRRAWDDHRPDFGDILERNVSAILGEIDRLAAIARSFSRFAAPGTAAAALPVPVDVSEVVAEVLDLYRSGGDGGVSFDAEISPDLPKVMARPDELKEVLVNLLENSRAATASGVVTITARSLLSDSKQEGAGVATSEDPFAVLLSVQDQGSGIAPQLLPRIFEPQFSTRSTGTGLGLAIVKRLVDSWDGEVDVESEEGVGTTMRVRLRKAATDALGE